MKRNAPLLFRRCTRRSGRPVESKIDDMCRDIPMKESLVCVCVRSSTLEANALQAVSMYLGSD
jgi:hypothetical protein